MRNLVMILVLSIVVTGLDIIGGGNMTFVAASSAAENTYAPQSNSERSINVTATLQGFQQGTTNLEFNVSLETHVHPLDDDLVKVSALVVDGKRYAPIAWEGSPPGGHHRRGVLRFGGIAPPPAAVELQIRLSGDADPRSFRWTLK